MKFGTYVKAVFRAMKGEIDELKAITPTDEDKEQADKLTQLICAAAASYGIPVSSGLRETISTSLSFGLRDLKDGVKCPDKLILMRIVDEIKAARKARNK